MSTAEASRARMRLGRLGGWTYRLSYQPATRSARSPPNSRRWATEPCGSARRYREPLTHAGHLLAATGRMVVATGIASIWARDPVTMTAAQLTLAEAYPDRFPLGLGVSHAAWSKVSAATPTASRWPRCAPTSTPWTRRPPPTGRSSQRHRRPGSWRRWDPRCSTCRPSAPTAPTPTW